jgi:hypothetical protein
MAIRAAEDGLEFPARSGTMAAIGGSVLDLGGIAVMPMAQSSAERPQGEAE